MPTVLSHRSRATKAPVKKPVANKVTLEQAEPIKPARKRTSLAKRMADAVIRTS